jgi:glycosyltransferase involved in cell wall biosynthesis
MERILIILPNLDQGGTERVVMNYFRASGLCFDFVVHGETGYFEPEARELGARIFRIPTRSKAFAKSINAMRGIYKQHPEYKTVIVCTEHSFAFIELMTAWWCGVKTRGAWSHFSDYQGKSKLKRCLHFITRPLLRLFGNLYLACTKEAGVWLFGNAGVQGKNFYIVKNAIPLDKFVYNPDIRKIMRDRLGLEGKFALGIVGRLAQVKNHAFALEAFAWVCEKDAAAVLLIIGDGELKAELEAQAARLKITENIIFTGAVENAADYFQALDVLLLPSLHEGFPVVAVEAQAAGLPVLLSDTLSRELALTPLAQYISLTDGAEAWSTVILAQKNRPREATDLTATGFHIGHAAQRLRKILFPQGEPPPTNGVIK